MAEPAATIKNTNIEEHVLQRADITEKFPIYDITEKFPIYDSQLLPFLERVTKHTEKPDQTHTTATIPVQDK